MNRALGGKEWITVKLETPKYPTLNIYCSVISYFRLGEKIN